MGLIYGLVIKIHGISGIFDHTPWIPATRHRWVGRGLWNAILPAVSEEVGPDASAGDSWAPLTLGKPREMVILNGVNCVLMAI